MKTVIKSLFINRSFFLSLALCFSLVACGNDGDVSVDSDRPSDSSSAKEGAITFRVINSESDDYGNCIISIAEINNSGHDLRTLQISKYEAQTALGKTSSHSVLYDGMKNGESRKSKFHIKAPSCEGLTLDIVGVLCSMKDMTKTCDNEIEFILEGNNDVKLVDTFKS